MNTPYYLAIIAHPDDETIYLSGLMMQKRDLPWKVICVTDADADGEGEMRIAQLEQALKRLEISSFETWGLPDLYEKRLDTDLIQEKLVSLSLPNEVYTHGIIGEYGHPHHQDVSYAAHNFYHNRVAVYSISYNCYPDFTIQLNSDQYQLKVEILSKIYGSEINRFAHLVPATSSESFAQVGIAEVEAIYHFLTGKGSLVESKLNKYAWAIEHIKKVLAPGQKRLF